MDVAIGKDVMGVRRLKMDGYTAISGVAAVASLAVCVRELSHAWFGGDEVSLSALGVGIASLALNVWLFHWRA